jgi:ABC-type glutathione transport system ATPase component
MNADRIIVVTGGEIVEQGSHEDLIRADGKYAELWSKQIFVKPKDTEPREDKPATKGRKAPNIVNDLTAEATSSELAKVKSTPTTNGQANGQANGHVNGQAEDSDSTEDTANTPTTPSHKKEV